MIRSCALNLTLSEFRSRKDEEILEEVKVGFREMTGFGMSIEQERAWKGAIPKLQEAFSGGGLSGAIHLVFEYRLPMSNERIDLILIGRSENDKPTAVIMELKGWSERESIIGDQDKYRNPVFQVLSYTGRLKLSHSSSQDFELVPCVWLYNMLPSKPLSLSTLSGGIFWQGEHEQLHEFLMEKIPNPPSKEEVKKLLEGKYVQTLHLLQAIKKNFIDLKQGALHALCETGFAPSAEQLQIIEEVMQSVRENEKVCYLIEGQPGSGKSYLAVLLLLSALKDAIEELEKELMHKKKVSHNLKERHIAILGYRNGAVVKTLRKVFDECMEGLGSALIEYYTTGHGNGLAEGGHRDEEFKLVIYDEAQRMRYENISLGLKIGRVVVILYDEKQILNIGEEGTRKNFYQTAYELGFKIREKTLRGIYRVQGGAKYHEFVENLLNDPTRSAFPELIDYEFRTFNTIEDMIEELGVRVKRDESKVALAASYTDEGGSRGSNERRIKVKAWWIDEETGCPDFEIRWVDQNREYPDFWYRGKSNGVELCASIYGSQGFEADYVGVIWGPDLVVKKNGKGEIIGWEVGRNCIDQVGSPTLEGLVKAKSSLALRLLINRYRIFLTRGIKGTYIYCEDNETRDFLRRFNSFSPLPRQYLPPRRVRPKYDFFRRRAFACSVPIPYAGSRRGAFYRDAGTRRPRPTRRDRAGLLGRYFRWRRIYRTK